MCRTSSITLLIYCLFSLPTALYAQNTFGNLNNPYNLLLERNSLFQKALPEPESIYVQPIAIPGEYKKEDGYETFISPLFYKSPLLFIKNSSLIYEYRYGLKSSPLATRQMITEKPSNAKVNRKAFYALYNKPRLDEKKRLRESWKRAFGFDVWYPYYKTKAVEDWVKEKLSVKVFRIKGKPRFENKQILYVFNLGF